MVKKKLIGTTPTLTPANPTVWAYPWSDPDGDWIPLTISTADIDFTNPEGPTNGICPRAIAILGGGGAGLYFTGSTLAMASITPGSGATVKQPAGSVITPTGSGLTMRTVTSIPTFGRVTGRIAGIAGTTNYGSATTAGVFAIL